MKKKYAILGDIHDNIDALDVILADAKGQGVTDYACVGDIIGYNATPHGECLDRIRELGCVAVRGNHEYYNNNPASEDGHTQKAIDGIRWTRKQLNAEQLQWLCDLPLQRNVGDDFMMIHCTLDNPEHNRDNEASYVRDIPRAEASLANQKAFLCFHGHTHSPAVFEKQGEMDAVKLSPHTITLHLGRKYFVNPGSVGQPRDGNPRASYCIYTPQDRLIEFRRLAYPIETAQERIMKAGLGETVAERLAKGK